MVLPIPAFADNYIWALIDKEAGIFDCVDPGDAEPVLKWAQTKQLTLRTILLTHHHADHTGGVNDLITKYPSCVVYSAHDARIPQTHIAVREHQILTLPPYSFQILFNPGHTSSHISYYEKQHKWLFCGDTLFSGGCGRVFDGTLEQLHQSLLLFKTLDPGTKIFCAHEYTEKNLRFAQTVEPDNLLLKQYLRQVHKQPGTCTLPSTLELELAINPFLRTEKKTVQEYALKHKATSTNSLEVFRVLREQKDQYK